MLIYQRDELEQDMKRLRLRIAALTRLNRITLVVVSWCFLAFWTDAQSANSLERNYEIAKSRLATGPADPEALWKFGRACYDFADFSAIDAQREKIAEEGMAACDKLIQQQKQSIPGHYYLGMNLHQLSRTKTFGASKIVKQMEAEFKTVLDLDPKYDFAGPDRMLGLFYLDSPRWPFGFGDMTEARKHLAKALELAPEYPENHLDMIEAGLKTGDKREAPIQLETLAAVWPEAQKKFTGEEWAANW